MYGLLSLILRISRFPLHGQQALLKDLQASQVNVEDVSGGCGAAYAVYVESPLFKVLSSPCCLLTASQGKNMVAQHKMVTSTLREQIKDMHSITIKTKVTS